jgi:hypothetical protein
MNKTKVGSVFLIAVSVVVLSFLVFDRGSGAVAQQTRQPFANAVQQRAEMIRELKEIKTLLKEQNSLLREIAGKAEK